MQLTRRRFLAGTAAATAALATLKHGRAKVMPPSETAATDEALVAAGLDAAKKAGASYADVRVERIAMQSIASRDDYVRGSEETESAGVGVRVLVDGVWGFAATYALDTVEVSRASKRAVELARANKKLAAQKVELAPLPAAKGQWTSPHTIDPFTIPIKDKAELLVRAGKAALAVVDKTADRKLIVTGHILFIRQQKLFGSTDGTLLRQVFLRGQPSINVDAIDNKAGAFESASSDSQIPAQQIGWEVTQKHNLEDVARTVATRALRRMGAQPVEPGKYDLVIDPSNLWLTVHESVGHPTEFDRILGYEANFAGTSFVRPADLGQLRYGAPIVNLVADRLQPGALASCGWDDDGTPADKWDLVRDGTLVGVQTTREQAAWQKGIAPHSGSYAQSWADVPFQRMPNVSLEPGKQQLTPQQLIADTKRGIFVDGHGSWSIDHQRYNFQFTAQAFTLIENGKLTRPVGKIAYQSNSLDFWRSCDAICDQRNYQVGGSLFDGKGEPMQINPVSHGCATARFRNVNVIKVGA